MLTAMGDVMRRCYERGWITTRDGNASLRKANSKYVHITPSGVRKNKIEVESLIKMKILNDDLSTSNSIAPSGELHMHWLILKNATRTKAIVHVHPTHVVAAMYAGFDLDKLAKEFPEIHRYTRVGPNVPNLPAVSKELGEATAIALGVKDDGELNYDIVGQANHGVCAVANDPWTAYEHIERLDHICEIVLKSGVKS